ncbi:4120_t:CDS:1, partial [Gigaspora margarita]
EKINPFSLILNYINKRNDIINASLVCKEWKNILDNYNFWKKKNEKFGFGLPLPKAKKYKTHYSIFIKNSDKLCWCNKELSTGDTLIRDIYFKIHILEEFCENRNKFYKIKPYNTFITFVQKEINKVIKIIKNEYYYRTGDNCKNYIINQIQILISSIKKEKGKKEKEKKFSNFFYTDFFNIIIHNLYKIINEKDLYIERFGGFVKNFNHSILKFVDYDAIKQEKEEGLYNLLNPNYRKFIENY